MRDSYDTCHSCDVLTSVDVRNVTENCSICSNRELKGNYCILKTCPENNPLRDSSNTCHSCDDVNPIILTDPNTCSTICPKRFLNNPHHKQCILCGAEGTAVENKPIWDWQGNCYSCDDTRCIAGGVEGPAQEATAANCNSACPNRVKNGQYCCTAICSGDKPLYATDGHCYGCNDTTHSITNESLTDDCETLCPNRMKQGQFCVIDTCPENQQLDENGACHNKCTLEVPLRNRWGTCYSCDEVTQVDVASVTENCNVCPNRELKDNYCILKTCPENKPLRDKNNICHSCDDVNPVELKNPDTCSVVCPKRFLNNPHHKRCILCGAEGTAVEDKPIWDYNGNCYACDDPRKINGGGEGLAQEATAANCNSACPNRVKEDLFCVRETCPSGMFERSDTSICYKCNITTSIPSTEEECNRCINRVFENGYCKAANK